MDREIIGCLLIVSPFLILMVISYICGWAKAIDDYKSKDNEAGLIVMSLFTIVSILVLTGVYLICTK